MKHYYFNYLANPNYGILVDLIMCTFHFLSYSRTCYFFLIPVGNYMFTVNNRNTRTRCKTCSKLTIKTQS